MKRKGSCPPEEPTRPRGVPPVEVKSFIDRFDATDVLIEKLAERARSLGGGEDDRILFSEALEELRITLEEMQAATEELSQQGEELTAARGLADEERRRYLALFAFAPDAYIVTDRSGVVVEANERAGALFGIKPSLMARTPLVALVDRKDRRAYFAKLAQAVESERLADWEIYFKAREKAFPALVDITTIRDRKGNVSGLRWLIRDATEAKRRELEAQLATFPELDPDPVVEVDRAGHVFYLNRAAKRLLPGLGLRSLDHPWFAGLGEIADKLSRSKRRSVEREVEIDGRWFLQSFSSPGPGGRLRIYSRDITRRKRAEDALLTYQAELEGRVDERTAELARSTGLLERMFASVDLAIAYLDKDFDFLRVNRAFADAFGRVPEDYPGQNFFALYPDDQALAVFRRVVDTGEPYVEFESPFLRGDSRPAGSYWDWSLQRVMSEDAVEGVVLSLVDVTPRIKAEEDGRRLSTVVEQSAEAVVITDTADRVLYVNQTFQDLHRLGRSDVLGRRYGDIIGFEGEDDAFRQKLRMARDGGEVWKGRLTRPIGGQPDRKLDVTISPVRDPSGRVINTAILEHDATHEHRLEISLRNLQRLDALGALAGGIAHDFNNILVPIFINAELAAFDADRDGPTARYLKLILEAAARGRELVRQIIAFSRPTEQPRGIIDLTAVIKEAARFLRSSIPRSIAIVERFDVAEAPVRADPTQISQVLMNLGTNAAYAMREQGGRLTIALGDIVVGPAAEARNPELQPGPYIKLSVEDTGTGIPPELLDRIFDPFFTTKRRGEGTGMGLPVVRGIVKSHGGAVTVSSAPGRGTTFDIYFPEARGHIAAPRSAPEAPTGKGRILFVDDEDMLVRSVKPMLERLGYSVRATTDPAEALTIFEQRPEDFDLVLTDETMPGLTGERLAQEMLRIRPGLPIILSTGFSESVLEEDLLASGIRGFIMKPFSTAEIAEKIKDALKPS